jgi:hypothetical protein
MLREIYLLLKNHLSATVTALKYIDWDLGQYNQAGEDYVLTTPSAYISFAPITWNTRPGQSQQAILNFTITLVSDTVYGTEQDMTDQDFIDHLGIEGEMHAAFAAKRFLLSELQEFAALAGTDNDRVMIETISRTSSDPHSELSNLIVTSQTFQTNIHDYGAVKSFQTVLAQLRCDITVNNNQS